jgi:AGZA family xanthine/uracil permease-like MFS transporter
LLSFTVDKANLEAGGASYKSIVPSLVNFTDKASVLALIGVLIIVVLMLLKVKGSILIGILATTIIGIPMGVTHIPQFNASDFLPQNPAPTFAHLDVLGLFSDPSQLFKIIMLIISFSLADTFDTIGTFLGTGRKTGIFDAKDEESLHKGKGFSSKLDKALFADATATSIGAVFGTSNTTTYVESAAGIAAGGRTGLTSVTTAVLFIACLFLWPVVSIVPSAATSPALIVVGILMMESLGKVKWSEFEDAASAFFTAVVMPFAYSIASGVAAGFIFYVVAKIFKGKAKEVHPIMYIVTLLFVLKYLVDALQIL